MKNKRQKFYAIKIGKGVENKIVTSWEECKELVQGFPAVYKSFFTIEEAVKYLDTVDVDKVRDQARYCMENKLNKIYVESKPTKVDKVTKPKVKKEPIRVVRSRLTQTDYFRFEEKCKEMGLDQSNVIKQLILEWLD